MNVQNIVIKTILKGLRVSGKLAGKDNFPVMRKNFDKACTSMPLEKGVKFKPITIAGIPSEWAVPPKCDNRDVILYFHGGGYCIGSIEAVRVLCSKLASESERAVLTFEYRLAPENPYPAGLEDALTVYHWLLEGDYDPKRISFAGDSAGAGLMLSAMLYLRDKKIKMPACAVAFSPWTDLTASSESLQRNLKKDPFIDEESVRNWAMYYAAGQDLKKPYLSAVYGDYHDFPPVLIQVGTEETLYDDSIRAAAQIKATGGNVELEIFSDMVHVFQQFWTWLPEAKDALKKTAAFIKIHTKQLNRFEKTGS